MEARSTELQTQSLGKVIGTGIRPVVRSPTRAPCNPSTGSMKVGCMAMDACQIDPLSYRTRYPGITLLGLR